MLDLTSQIDNIFELSRGDTATPITVQLFDSEDANPDLTGATVKLNIKRAGGLVWKEYTMSASDHPKYAQVTYQPTGTEFLLPGKYYGQVKATLANGKVLTTPSKGFFLFLIEDSNN